jgi:hypothetical protein
VYIAGKQGDIIEFSGQPIAKKRVEEGAEIMKRALLAIIAVLAAATMGVVAMGGTTSSDPVSPSVTFNKDVLPILQKNCQSCHRPGEIGPMPLLTYQQARPWAKAIKVAVATKKMPPWFADPHYGEFANARKLTPEQIATLEAWADNGAPEGDAKDAPAPVQFTDGWQIKPDVIISMPHTLPVNASGTMEYINIVLPTGFTKDTWIAAAEIRPRDRSVVHHAAVFVRPPGSRWLPGAKYGEPYIEKPGIQRDANGFEIKQPKATSEVPIQLRQQTSDPTRVTGEDSEWLAAYIPGMQPWDFRLGNSAKLVPAGSDIVINLHFTPNGIAKEDAVDVGLVLATEPPQHRYLTVESSAPHTMVIPANDPNFEVHSSLVFAKDVQLVWFQPHMHVRGKDMTYKVVYPDGRTDTLLSVPNYSFSWQLGYNVAKPIFLPKGTRIEVTAHFDNSANNPYNPNPNLNVPWGDQSWEEMMAAFMGVIVDDKSLEPAQVIEPKSARAQGSPASD